MTVIDQEPSLLRRIAALSIDWFIALATAAALTGTPMFREGRVNEWIPLLVFWLQVSVLVGFLGYSIGKRWCALRCYAS